MTHNNDTHVMSTILAWFRGNKYARVLVEYVGTDFWEKKSGKGNAHGCHAHKETGRVANVVKI